ncbi:MAG: DUF1127 domain-containing protein [Roseobacter sp.]
MAYHSADAVPAHDFTHRVIAQVKSFFSVVGTSLVMAASTNRRLHLVDRLSAKSDAELAALGIRREDIVRHVFIDMLDI